MTMLQHGLVPSTGGYQIERSLRFNSADSAYLDRTPASAGNRKTWTWSAWVKKSTLGAYQTLFGQGTGNVNVGYGFIRFDNTDTFTITASSDGATSSIGWTSTPVYRDPSAWYHVVAVLDTTQATAANRFVLYINGVSQAGSFSTTPTQNADIQINRASAHQIGAQNASSLGNYLSSYLADVYFIDGSAKTPSDFGETDTDTGVWKPKAYSGSYGTNGFYLKFADNSGTTSTTLGKDSSGNGNNWTPNNFSVTAGAGNDSLVDTPTPYGTDTGAGGEVRGNYCTWNPLTFRSGYAATWSNGNLDVSFSDAGTYQPSYGTIGISSGKWYWEVLVNAVGSEANIGISTAQPVQNNMSQTFRTYKNNGNKQNESTSVSYGASYTANDVIGVALDIDAGTIVFYKNNSSQGTAYTDIASAIPSAGWTPFAYGYNGTSLSVNFGQRPFAYTAPSGFKALCTQNLPTPTIGATATTRADDYFNTVLYTGTGSSLGVTGVGFQPDWVWIKERSGAADHGLYDAVRGVQKQLESNNTDAETTETTGLTAFNSDGFTVGALAQLNTNTDTYVAWNWKANGAGSSNTAGTITSTVSANTTAGFSIVTFTTTGATGTVGHGLGVAPKFIIIKRRGSANSWYVFTTAIDGSYDYLELNTTAAKTDSAYSSPTSTVFSYNDSNNETQVAYCFAPVAGYSAFGSYTGNGSSDGPFVYTGFRPRYILIKSSNQIANWQILDTARNTYNAADKFLRANSSIAESTNYPVDILSNGFKLRNTDGDYNASASYSYVYAAFAEVPTKFSLAR